MNYIFQNDLPDSLAIDGDVALDTEAMGLNVKRDRLCLIQISNGDGNAYIVQFSNKDYSAPNLRKLLTNTKTEKIFHFARFDLAMIKHYMRIDLVNIFCTRTASRLVRTYSGSHSLKELCKEFLNIQLAKHHCSSDWGIDELSREQQEYAASDVLYLHKLKGVLATMLVREKRFELANKIFQFIPTIVELDLCGWPEIDIFAHHE